MLSRFVVAGAAAAALAAADESVAVTPLGSVKGLVFDSFRVFQGVPYAAPPVGALRWAPPAPVAAWAPTVWDATVEGAGCPQLCVEDEPPHICPPVQDESCLFMNIWTPRAAALSSPAPVIVFWHGGNFHDGYTGGLNLTGGLLYDGSTFVNTTGAIIVVANYRLGALGFLHLGGDSTVDGNFGLRDQEASLAWVRANIAGFGGDPTRITVMGQSAGAMSISAHMSRPAFSGQAHGAIMMSNPFGEPYRSVSDAVALAGVFANFSGCPVTNNDWAAAEACLRKADAATIVAAQMAAEVDLIADLSHLLQVVVVWSPTVGTPYLPQRPMEAWQAGNVVDIPYMIGTTSNESVIFVYEALDFPLTQLEYELAADVLVGPAGFAALQPLYPVPAPPPADFRVFASTLLTDGLFLCATRNASEAMAAAQPYRRSAAFHWLYSHQMSWSTAMWGANFTECDNAVCHGSDLPAWWHPVHTPSPSFGNYTPEEDALSATMQWYFAAFAATGDPGVGNPAAPAPAWPAYNATTRATLNLEVASGGGITVVPSYRAAWCDAWDAKIGYAVY